MARPEVTGRKTGGSAGPAKPEDSDEPPEQLAMTVREFCDRHGISEGMYFKIKKQDKGPVEMRVGAKILISHEAASKWRKARETDIKAHKQAEKTWVEARAGLYVKSSKAKTKRTTEVAGATR